MRSTLDRLTKYIKDVLGVYIHPEKDSEVTRKLPVYLNIRYEYFRAQFLNTSCILCLDSKNEKLTPAVVEKHFHQIRDKSNNTAVYITDAITSYDRNRLIERKIPFIVPGNQMYLPFLGLDLREYFLNTKTKEDSYNSATQYIFLYLLCHNENKMTLSEIASILGYSKMTASRAYQDFKTTGIGETIALGKSNQFRLRHSIKEEWETALPYLKNPSQKRIYIRDIEPDLKKQMTLAGESALARISMLQEPRTPVYAISQKEWKILKNETIAIPYPEEKSVQLELWAHPVIIDPQTGQVNLLALYLSLKNEPDERLQKALNQAMEEYKW